MRMLKRLGWFFKQEWKPYLSGILALAAVAVLEAFVPMITANIVDSISNKTLTWDSLKFWIIVLLAIAIIQYALRYVWRIGIFGSANKLEKILRGKLFNHYTKMDRVFYQKYRTGDLMSRATSDVNAVRMVAGPGILTLVDAIVQGLSTIVMMFVAVDWRLTIVAIIPLPIITWVFNKNGKRVHLHSSKAQEAYAAMNVKAQESVTGVKVIKTFGEEELDIEDFNKYADDVYDKQEAVAKYGSINLPTVRLVMGACNLLSVFYGGFLVSRGVISIGLLVAFLSYIQKLTWPTIATGRLINILERGDASYSRVQEILNEKVEIKEKPDAIASDISGDIYFAVENFNYPNDTSLSLKAVKFELKKGQTLGIVGKTSSGKSTILKLLLRDYDDYDGIISYSGIDIKDYTLASIRRAIGYVPQENFLFSTSVYDNISFSNVDASYEQVVKVAEIADIHEDIMDFPDGYDTEVGESGVGLSGGQRQRIAIARALLQDPEILLLDDSLSAVDAKTEKAILERLKKERKDKTNIIVSHRMSSVMHADNIIVIEDGYISESGTHEELIENAGWYAKMYNKQQLEEDLLEGE